MLPWRRTPGGPTESNPDRADGLMAMLLTDRREPAAAASSRTVARLVRCDSPTVATLLLRLYQFSPSHAHTAYTDGGGGPAGHQPRQPTRTWLLPTLITGTTQTGSSNVPFRARMTGRRLFTRYYIPGNGRGWIRDGVAGLTLLSVVCRLLLPPHFIRAFKLSQNEAQSMFSLVKDVVSRCQSHALGIVNRLLCLFIGKVWRKRGSAGNRVKCWKRCGPRLPEQSSFCQRIEL